jgi:hypothetical protein
MGSARADPLWAGGRNEQVTHIRRGTYTPAHIARMALNPLWFPADPEAPTLDHLGGACVPLYGIRPPRQEFRHLFAQCLLGATSAHPLAELHAEVHRS